MRPSSGSDSRSGWRFVSTAGSNAGPRSSSRLGSITIVTFRYYSSRLRSACNDGTLVLVKGRMPAQQAAPSKVMTTKNKNSNPQPIAESIVEEADLEQLARDGQTPPRAR